VAAHERRPRRAELGQHFLRRGALAADIVARAPLAAHGLVVEIGAGKGTLTRALVLRGARVRAVELDPALAARLRIDFATEPHVEIIEGDFLAISLPREPYRVIGNIPFARTAEIVRRLVDASHPPVDALLVVQREAAERFAGSPYARESLRSLLLKPWWHVEIVRALPAREFDPPPSVDGALLWLARRPRPLVDAAEAARYRAFVTATFGRGGRAAGGGLRGVFTRAQLERLGRALRFDPGRDGDPPSALTFDQWLALFRASGLLPRGAPGIPGGRGGPDHS